MPGDFEARLAALEARVDMEAGLRASQDSDLAELATAVRSQTLVTQAMAATQIEHGTLLRNLTVRLARLEVAAERAEGRFTDIDEGLLRILSMLRELIDRDAS